MYRDTLSIGLDDQQGALIVLDIYTRLVKEDRQNVTIQRITGEGVNPWNQHLRACRSGYKQKTQRSGDYTDE